MRFINSAGIDIEISEEEIEKRRGEFRCALTSYGLDRFISFGDVRILEMPCGKLLAQLRTMALPNWYPNRLQELRNSGFEVITKLKRSNKYAPCEMYWVQQAYEIGGKQNGNQ